MTDTRLSAEERELVEWLRCDDHGSDYHPDDAADLIEALAAENESLRARIAQPSSDEVREAADDLRGVIDAYCRRVDPRDRFKPGHYAALDTLTRAATIPPEVAEAWERYTDITHDYRGQNRRENDEDIIDRYLRGGEDS
jgi:hypothetical protein